MLDFFYDLWRHKSGILGKDQKHGDHTGQICRQLSENIKPSGGIPEANIGVSQVYKCRDRFLEGGNRHPRDSLKVCNRPGD